MSAFSRMIRRRGETWTMSAWTSASRDEYEDELPTGEVSSTFKAIRISAIADSERERDEMGVTRWSEVELLVDAELTLPDNADPEQPVTLTSPEGRTFSLIGVDLSGTPVGAKRLRARSGGGDARVYL